MAVALVVFDLVGTTVQADDAVPRAFTAALALEGVAVDGATLATVRGASKRQVIARLLPGGPEHAVRVERAHAHFQRTLLETYGPGGATPIEGASDVVAGLRAAGVRVALNTGFDRALTARLLDGLGWTAVADAVVCGDDVPLGRPAPYLIYRAMERTGVVDVARVANVGDTALDLQAGHHARAGWNIGVWSGAHDRATLARAPHTHLCASIREVPALVGLGSANG